MEAPPSSHEDDVAAPVHQPMWWSMFGNVFCSRQTLFLYNGGVYNWVFIFSMNISSVHFNQQLLLTRSTRLHNEVSNHLTLGHQFSCLHQQSDCKLTGMDLHLCVGVLYFGCMWYISMFSVIVSTSAHFNRQLLLTRFTEPDIKVSSYLNLIHFSQNAVCGWSRLESDPITVQSCSIYSGDSSNCIVLPKKWNEQEPRGRQCANWRMMDQNKHHQWIISLDFFQGISMLSYSSIWIWERATVLF